MAKENGTLGPAMYKQSLVHLITVESKKPIKDYSSWVKRIQRKLK